MGIINILYVCRDILHAHINTHNIFTYSIYIYIYEINLVIYHCLSVSLSASIMATLPKTCGQYPKYTHHSDEDYAHVCVCEI